MKKLLVIVGICLVLAAMPMTTASPLTGLKQMNKGLRHAQPLPTNGGFIGVLAEKNETGYVPLGTFVGTYAGDTSGTFTGNWILFDGSASGTISGRYWGYIFFGQMNTTGVEGSNYFIGLFRANTTDHTFNAGAIILGNNDYSIRYAMGTFQ